MKRTARWFKTSAPAVPPGLILRRCHGNKGDQASDKRVAASLPTPHRGDYLTQHRVDGRLDPASCFPCHGRKNVGRCATCHK
jgi:hypothetical protein